LRAVEQLLFSKVLSFERPRIATYLALAVVKMIVHITSIEKNAVFSIAGPDGSVLPGAEEEADASDWTGEIPMNGDYSISVSPTRGNATYTLEVTIR